MTQPYPAYRESGHEWFEELPAHWEIWKLGHAIPEISSGTTPATTEERYYVDGTIPWVNTGDLNDGILYDCAKAVTTEAIRDHSPLKIYEPGALVIALYGATIGRLAILDFSACVNQACCVMVPSTIVDTRFLFFWISGFRDRVIALATGGGQPNISQDVVRNLRLCFPPLPEQTAIAAFLDLETAKIDGLVAQQRRLIDLLREKRQAVISHAVTRGLDPTAPLKPSGIDWLGDVPEGWRVAPLKMVATVQTGIAKGKDTTGIKTIEVPYLRVANVQDGHIDLTEVATMEIPVESLHRYTLKPGDVLMNEGGDFDKLGRGHVWDGQIDPCIHQNHVFAVRPHGVSPDWLNLVTGTAYAQYFFMGRSKQSTNLASISSTNLMELPVVIPPKQEQAAILTFLVNMRARLDTLTATAFSAIALLQERRAALISAAVTGKIDVRGGQVLQQEPV